MTKRIKINESRLATYIKKLVKFNNNNCEQQCYFCCSAFAYSEEAYCTLFKKDLGYSTSDIRETPLVFRKDLNIHRCDLCQEVFEEVR